jgi:Domain of unknown function (DUF4062)
VRAAYDGVAWAGIAPVDIGYFATRDGRTSDCCRDRVRQCEVCVGVAGFRYESIVPGEVILYAGGSGRVGSRPPEAIP